MLSFDLCDYVILQNDSQGLSCLQQDIVHLTKVNPPPSNDVSSAFDKGQHQCLSAVPCPTGIAARTACAHGRTTVFECLHIVLGFTLGQFPMAHPGQIAPLRLPAPRLATSLSRPPQPTGCLGWLTRRKCVEIESLQSCGLNLNQPKYQHLPTKCLRYASM